VTRKEKIMTKKEVFHEIFMKKRRLHKKIKKIVNFLQIRDVHKLRNVLGEKGVSDLSQDLLKI
jgi:arginine repressor